MLYFPHFFFFVFSFEKFDHDVSNHGFGEFILFGVYSASSIFSFSLSTNVGHFQPSLLLAFIWSCTAHLALLSFALPHFADIAFFTN